MTIDLFGADQSSNAATFYSAGLKGRFEEGKRADDHRLKGATLHGAGARRRPPRREARCRCCNALNEVLRDDYIKDSVGGVDRWNKVIEKAGLPFRLSVPHKAFHRRIGALAGARIAPDGRVVSEAEWSAHVHEWLPSDEDRAFVASLMGRVVEPGKFANWIAPPVDGHQPAAGRLRVRPLQLSRGATMTTDAAAVRTIKQHLIDPEICIRCNTCEATCPIGAITHDDRNYVVHADKCNAATAPASRRARPARSTTGALVPATQAYSLDEQLGWDALPPELHARRARGRRRAGGPDRPRRAAGRRVDPAHGGCGGGAARCRALLLAAAALVGRACLHESLHAEGADDRHRDRQLPRDRRGLRQRHAPRRARLRHHALPGARGPVDRHRAAGGGRARAAAPRAPVLDREPAQRRAAGLQQRLAHGEARHGGPPGPRRCAACARTTSATSRSATRCR